MRRLETFLLTLLHAGLTEGLTRDSIMRVRTVDLTATRIAVTNDPGLARFKRFLWKVHLDVLLSGLMV